MSAWISLLLPSAIALAVLGALGLPIAFALRLKGFFAFVTAIPAALGVLALAAIFAPSLGQEWSFFVPLALAAVIVLVLLFIGTRLGPQGQPVARPHRATVPLVSAALGGLAIAATLVMSLKAPDAISQTFDANFHLNAVRQILDTGNASPFDLDLAAPGTSVFYPALWHGFVALVAQISGASIPLATNAVVFVVCAVIWPLGMVTLGRAVAGPSLSTTLISGVLAAAFPNFPLALVGYGVLYPNLLSIALVPYIVVALMQLLGLARARTAERSSLGVAWLLLAGSLGASVLAHPNAIHISLLWLAAPALFAAIRAWRGDPVGDWSGRIALPQASRKVRKLRGLIAPPLLVLAFAAAWYAGRTFDNPWGGKHSPVAALIDALGLTPHLEGHVWPLSLLVLLGSIAAWRSRKSRWALASALVLLGIYVIADGFPPSAWRTSILAPWYSDPWRLSALVWLGVFPLAVLGATKLWRLASVGVRRATRMLGRKESWYTFVAGFSLVFLLAATQGAGAYAGVQFVSKHYSSSSDSRLLTPDERTLLERVSDFVAPDEVIINNPWNGGALAYALGDRQVLTPHTGGRYDPRILELIAGIDRGGERACELSAAFNARFVLDFGTEYVFKGTPLAKPYEPISDIQDAPALTEVDREGDAVLYRVDGCD
ncbi:DUF6541 family protein [Leucobacter sp. NPDC015123]|uniref:DUF6541 family protein n=1 Tax=Leucobacter sp. NPDC015123 TaxID=3364129 RepID=UPI0036F463C1